MYHGRPGRVQAVRTVPRACPYCAGSGQVFAWPNRRPPPAVTAEPFWWLYAGVGFMRLDCPRCLGIGTPPSCVEPAPADDPAQWAHRVPAGISRE